MSNNSGFPWYFTINDRPVKVVATSNGGMDVLIANLTTGKLERDLQYLAYCFEPGQNVQRLSEAEFNMQMAALQASLRDRTENQSRKTLEPWGLPELSIEPHSPIVAIPVPCQKLKEFF